MAAQQRQVPGGPFFNEQGTTRQAQVPGAQTVNEVAAAAADTLMGQACL